MRTDPFCTTQMHIRTWIITNIWDAPRKKGRLRYPMADITQRRTIIVIEDCIRFFHIRYKKTGTRMTDERISYFTPAFHKEPFLNIPNKKGRTSVRSCCGARFPIERYALFCVMRVESRIGGNASA